MSQTVTAPAPQPAPAPPPITLAGTVLPPQSGTTVTLVASAEEGEPFRMNPVFISLGLPRSAFATQVGGEPAVLPPGSLQGGWRQCRRCLGLFFGVESRPGRCPSGGDHQAMGSFALTCGDGSQGQEAGWRRCGKCLGAAFAGGAPGTCAAGGTHETGESPAYALAQGNAGRGAQGGWRRCGKCLTLVLTNGRPGGTCPAGGQHDTAASGAYAVNTAAPPRGNQPVLKPQLFLIETYLLTNYRTALLRDEMLATLQSMLPRQTITCRMLTRKRTSEEVKQGSTVLDAQTSEAAQGFNNSLKQSSEQKFGTNEYQYAMESNFAGKVSAGLGSGSAKAHLDVSGGTSNVRNELANSVDTALDSQVSQANQARRESVRVASSDSKVETTNETEVTVTTTNPTDLVQNFAIYQLRQEHVSILSLVDVEVAFLNGEPKSTQRVPLFRLDELLGAVIADPEERTTIKAQIRACLAAIRDNNDQAQSLIQDDAGQPTGFVVNKRMRSNYELRNADGSVRQVLSAPGVILRAVTKQLKKPGATVVAAIQ